MKKTLLLFILLFFVGVLGKSIYDQATQKPKSAKASRLACHAKVTTFERIYDLNATHSVRTTTQNRGWHLTLATQPSQIMPPALFAKITPLTIQSMAHTLLGDANESQPTLALLVYENDTLDPNKKNEEAKKYAGYIVAEALIEGKSVYKIQIDFMQHDGSDINATLNCIHNSLMTLH